jgi:hypothetical protein
MKYTLIKGRFHVVGYSPDGDSMMFKATNPALWAGLGGENKPLFEEKLAKEEGAVQLRLQGIDALETHYSPEMLPTPPELRSKETGQYTKPVPGGFKQPAEIGKMATNEFMKLMGVKKAEWRTWGKNTWISKACFDQNGQEVWVDKKQQDKIPGSIVTGEVEKNGRPISWVFPGSSADTDGLELSKEMLASRVEQSANYQLLRRGLVYPYFFMTLAGRLRDKLAEAVRLAQADAVQQSQALKKNPLKPPAKAPNLWIYDKAADGLKIADLKIIIDEMELYPYLFRRVVKAWYRQQMQRYWIALRDNLAYIFDEKDKSVILENFFSDGDPYVFIISDQDFVKLSEVVQLKDNTLKLTRSPMDIVFLS